jgi:hypothetical protein
LGFFFYHLTPALSWEERETSAQRPAYSTTLKALTYLTAEGFVL